MPAIEEITQDIKAEALKIAKLNAHQLKWSKDTPTYHKLHTQVLLLCADIRPRR